MTTKPPNANPPLRVDDEVIFWDGTGRKLTECELGILDRGEPLIPAKGSRHWTLDPEQYAASRRP